MRVLKFEDVLNKQLDKKNNLQPDKDHNDSSESDSDEESINKPRGRPKSGRVWKSEKTRASSMVKTRGLRKSLKKKQELRQDLKRVKEITRAIKEERTRQKEEKRQRRQENLKRQEENRKKSEIVQVIKNTSKIKKMKKKHLRKIEKRDTNEMIK